MILSANDNSGDLYELHNELKFLFFSKTRVHAYEKKQFFIIAESNISNLTYRLYDKIKQFKNIHHQCILKILKHSKC
jgi:hypothetical protein